MTKPVTMPELPVGNALPPLWSHQRNAIAKAGRRFALFFDPGCGKSRTAIELLRRAIREELPCAKVIIFAPLNVCRNWGNELKQYFPDDYELFLVAGQTKGKKLKALEAFADYNPVMKRKHAVLVCNNEALRSKDYLKLLMRSCATFIIVDESHNFKNHAALQTKAIIQLERTLNPHYFYMLTGTPAPQGEIDLWSTFFLLKVTQDGFFIWRKKHFDDKNERRRGYPGYWPDYRIRADSKEKFRVLLDNVSLTAHKNEVLDLPPLIRTTLYAELGPEMERHYKTMEEFLFAIDSDGNELNASNLLSRTLRLQQILAGFLGDVPIKNNTRLPVLEDAIQKTAGGQFIIWTIFAATYQQIGGLLDSCGCTFGLLTGEQSAEERSRYMDDFQAGKIRALIAHPKAGGVGVNLTAASYSIHYTRSFSLTDDLQAEARNYRGGSERHERITRIDIVSPGTIDEEISRALKEKKSVQDFILGLKARAPKPCKRGAAA